jgi:branched-chain amino acid transport system permease protein
MLVYGLINSTVLALMALGFNLTFGISGVANFAYGAIYVVAGFLTWTFINQLSIPYALSAVLTI